MNGARPTTNATTRFSSATSPATAASRCPSSFPGFPTRTGDLPGSTVFAGVRPPQHPGGPQQLGAAPRLCVCREPQHRDSRRCRHLLWFERGHQFSVYGHGVWRHESDSLYQRQFSDSVSRRLLIPFRAGFADPQGQTYGAAALWGFGNNNSLDTGRARNAEIYQWNLGVQHLFPGQIVIGVDYSASRSTHLPYSSFSGTANRNFLPSSIRNQIVAGNLPACNGLGPSDCLAQQVPNPFQPLFVAGPDQMFNEPTSIYNDDTIPLINLLRPFPQFDGPFAGLTLLDRQRQLPVSAGPLSEASPVTTSALKETTPIPRPSTILRLVQIRSLPTASVPAIRKNWTISRLSVPSAPTTPRIAWFSRPS